MLSASDNGLAEIQFFQNNEKNKTPSKTNNKTLLTAGRQLMEYFKGERIDFDIPLDIQGSDFQKKVWKKLVKIPYGKTISYKTLAIKIGGSNYARAVAMANSKNKLPIIIPCHRVIAESGDLGGYSGGVENKQFFLNIETKVKTSERGKK